MNLKIILILTAVLCLSYSGLRADSHWNLSLEDNKSDGEYDGRVQDSIARADYKRDVLIGYFIAAVPGFFVHGAGNLYAKNYTRGGVLCLTGLVSFAGIFLYELGRGLSESSEPPSTGAKIWFGTSLALFFGSWFWDIMTVQDSIEERYPPQAYLSIGPIPSQYHDSGKPVLGLNLKISF